MDPLGVIPEIDDFNIIEVDNFVQLNIKDFQNIDNVFKISSGNTTIVNKRRLNMLERFGGNEFKMHNKYDDVNDGDNDGNNDNDNSNEWIEIKTFKEPIISMGPRLPLTNCLNQKYGDGGSLEFGLATAYILVETVDSDRTINLILYHHKFKERFEFQWAVGVSIGYGCNVPKGKTGQMFITPYLAQFSDIQIRTIKILFTGGWLTKKKMQFEVGEWQVDNPVKLFDISKTPIIQCITDESLLDCSGTITDGFHIF